MARAKYCYLEPDFPDRAIMVMAYMEDTRKHIFYPMDLIFKNKAEAIAQVKLIHQNLFQKGISVDAAVLYELKLNQKIELSKECWEGENKEKDGYWRYRRYLDMMSQPGLYEILILPRKWEVKRKKWQLAISVPFFRGGDGQRIEQFIRYSKDVVDIRAKYAATYSLEKAYRFNREKNVLRPVKMMVETTADAN